MEPLQGRAVQFSIQSRDFEDVVDVEGGAPSGVFDVGVLSGAEQIVGEGAQARCNVGVLSDARRVLGEGHVAHVMAAVLDAPVSADPRVPMLRRRPAAEETQKTISLVCLQSPVAGSRRQTVRSSRSTVLISSSHGVWRNHALAGNTVSSRVSQRLRPAAWLFAKPLGLRPVDPEFELAAQARLVVLDLGQQVIARCDHAREQFFWQCSASSVNRQSVSPSASINSGAAGISLLFSSTIR